MIPESLRISVRTSLNKQRLITDPETLDQLVDAACDGTVHDRASMYNFLRERGVKCTTAWVRMHATHLESIWNSALATAPANDSITVVSTALATTSHPPVPPPTSMVTLTRAMRNLWYKNEALPLVMPPAHADFDRNDWYGTNLACLRRLLGYSSLAPSLRSADTSLMFVRLYNGSREYITWCEKGEFVDFASKVNRGDVQCNDYVTRLIQSGTVFLCARVCDEIGHVDIEDVDDHLHLLEKYITAYGTRFPAGLNTTTVPHLGHRSLMYMGGNYIAMKVYIKWRETIQSANESVARIQHHLVSARATLNMCTSWAAAPNPDNELIESFRTKWEEQCNDAVRELARAEKIVAVATKLRMHLSTLVVDALADSYLKYPFLTPTFLLQLRVELQGASPDYLASARADVKTMLDEQSRHDMSIRRALIELEMWDGRNSIPFFTRQMVNTAFACIARRIHPDKTGVASVELPAQFQRARDCLHEYLKKR